MSAPNLSNNASQLVKQADPDAKAVAVLTTTENMMISIEVFAAEGEATPEPAEAAELFTQMRANLIYAAATAVQQFDAQIAEWQADA